MTAVREPHVGRVRAALPARRVPARTRMAATPLFTRHMLGAIEADRDRRRVFRDTHSRPGRRANGMAHPRIEAAIAADARLVGRVHSVLGAVPRKRVR